MPIHRNSTLLQAAHRLFNQMNDPSRSPWASQFKIQFEKSDKPPEEDAEAAAAECATNNSCQSSNEIMAATNWSALLEQWSLPPHIPSDSVALRSAIGLFKLVEELEAQQGCQTICQSAAGGPMSVKSTELPPSEWLTQKLHEQLQDCVTLCSQVGTQNSISSLEHYC